MRAKRSEGLLCAPLANFRAHTHNKDSYEEIPEAAQLLQCCRWLAAVGRYIALNAPSLSLLYFSKLDSYLAGQLGNQLWLQCNEFRWLMENGNSNSQVELLSNIPFDWHLCTLDYLYYHYFRRIMKDAPTYSLFSSSSSSSSWPWSRWRTGKRSPLCACVR